MKTLLLQSGSKKNIDLVAEMAAKDATKFNELVVLMKSKDNLPLAFRAAWAMSNSFERNINLIQPFYKDFIHLANETKHDAIKRNIVRVWSLAQIPKKFAWKIADICFKYLTNPKEAIAVKAFSITVLQNLVKQLPELQDEVMFEIEKQLPHSGPAFRSRANAFLKQC